MSDSIAQMRFSRIESFAVMANGKKIHRWNSYPMGADKAEYDDIVEGMFRAFGNAGTRVVGTPMILVRHP